MNNKKPVRGIAVLAVLVAALAGSALLALMTGSAHIPPAEILSVLTSRQASIEHSILTEIRLPRIILAVAVGGSLSLAGAILQGMFRNPLVEPYTLGISGGASLGVCFAIVLRLGMLVGPLAYPLSGFLGAALTVILVYWLSTRKATMAMHGVLLMGVMISFISSSLVMLVMAMSRAEDIHGIVFWVMGSLDEPNMFLVRVAVACSLAGLLAAYFFCMDLNALALGEEEALHLGVNVERTKRALFLVASVLAGVSVSVAGIIGFVGLVVPHFMRMVTGTDHRTLFAGSFLAGATFLILCDTVARTIISPLELPVGVITGIIGGLFFIYALGRRRVVL